MKKSKLLYTVLAIAVLFLSAGCSSKMLETESVWPENSINIDGSIDDWEEIPAISTDDDSTYNFKLCNDNDYLYMAFYSNDMNLSGQIKMMGAKLWIDSTGGKNKKRGLFFSGGPEMSKMRDSTLPEVRSKGKEMRFPGGNRSMDMESMEKDKFAVINDKGDSDPISKDGINGPAIEYGISNETLIYELKIPLRFKGLESFVIRANPGDEISICLELQGGKSESKRGQRPEGGPPGGMHMMNEQMGEGMPPGGRPGGGGPPPGGGPPGEIKKKEIWIKIHLALKEYY